MSEGSQTTRPFSRYEWMLAGRYLRARRQEGVISVIAVISFLGVMLGVGVLIVVMAVMNGFRIELLDKILGFDGHIIVQGPSIGLENYNELGVQVRLIEGVVSVAPLVEGQVMVQSQVNMTGALVRGMNVKDIQKLKALDKGLIAGSWDDFQGGDAILVGSRLAENLRVSIGNKLSLISPRGPNTAFGSAPRRKAYRIVGLFETGMSQYDAGIVFMPLEQSQLFFNHKDTVTALDVRVADPDLVHTQKVKLLTEFDPTLRIYDWQETNQTFVNALIVERNVMFLILTLIILIACLNIVSGLIMLVKDKGKGIAILRTMGASRGSILRIFFIAGSAIGVLGTLVGVILGVLFCLNIEAIRQFIMKVTGASLFDPNIYFLSQMPAEMDTGETMAVVIMALVLAFLATIYPAWRAARLDPVEGLRYE